MATFSGVFLAIVAAFGLAGQALTIRIATRRARSNDVLLVVMVVNLVVLIPLTLILVPDLTVTLPAVVAFFAAGVAGTMLGRALFFAGIQRIGASRAEPIKASMPLHATILAVLLLDEHVTGPQFLGVLLIVAGIVLLSRETPSGPTEVDGKRTRIGFALPLAAAFFFGLEPILASAGFREGTSVLAGLLIKAISAFAVFLLYLRWRDSIPSRDALRALDLRWSVLAGVFSTVFLLAYYAGLSVSRVAIVVPIMQMSPMIVVIVSAVWLRRIETVTPRIVAGAIVVVSGGITVTLTG